MTPARIVVVEDERVVARDIQHQLTRIGHTVVGVTPSGEDAVRLALESHPDLVLMDIRLEGALDGVDAAQQIRDRCQVPVVYLTAYADDETLRRARPSAAFRCLPQPLADLQPRPATDMAPLLPPPARAPRGQGAPPGHRGRTGQPPGAAGPRRPRGAHRRLWRAHHRRPGEHHRSGPGLPRHEPEAAGGGGGGAAQGPRSYGAGGARLEHHYYRTEHTGRRPREWSMGLG